MHLETGYYSPWPKRPSRSDAARRASEVQIPISPPHNEKASLYGSLFCICKGSNPLSIFAPPHSRKASLIGSLFCIWRRAIIAPGPRDRHVVTQLAGPVRFKSLSLRHILEKAHQTGEPFSFEKTGYSPWLKRPSRSDAARRASEVQIHSLYLLRHIQKPVEISSGFFAGYSPWSNRPSCSDTVLRNSELQIYPYA